LTIDLTDDETIAILDALRGRLDDLNDCAMFGDASEIEGEIETVDELFTKLAETLEAARG
jgi:hypothetical protein